MRAFPAGNLRKDLSLYSSPEEIRQLEQIENMLQTFETVQEMTQTMSAMQEIFPDMHMDSGDSAPMMDMLMNMLTPEQAEMYRTFSQTPSADNHETNT